MQGQMTQPQLTLSPTIAYDVTTDTYAAWCDELAVATSAPTAEEAGVFLLSAMRMAAEYVLGNAQSAGSAMYKYVPYAEAVASMDDDNLKALIDVHR
jgi:hypothetical protein